MNTVSLHIFEKTMPVDLSKLNPEQRKAVTHDKGPLLIIAGAGTGKTHVITSRILYLLEDKHVSFDSILGLTFTEKATEEIIERIDTALPYSYEEIAIHTFHGLCDKILRENGLEIGLDTSYKILTQLDQWIFIKKHLFDFELDYYRPLGNPNSFISAIATHFSRLKDEDISPENYILYAERNQDRKQIPEIAKMYKKYQELLVKENALDFNDLHYLVLRLFEKRPAILKKYQDRFKYILVDEFQDTNFTQIKLVNMLAKKHRNITVVGDDDQSIYRWRGASMSNILHFEKNFNDCVKIILKNNYRSTPNILDTAYSLIQNNNPDRLEHTNQIDKKLISQFDKAENVQVHNFENYVYEAKFIGDTIMEQLKSKDLSFKDLAILVRTHKLAKPFIEELKSRDIPYQVRNRESLLSLPEIKDLAALLHFVANPRNDIALVRILSYKMLNIPMQSIVEFLHEAKKEHDPLFKILYKSQNQPILDGIDAVQDSISKILNLLDGLISYSKNHSVSEVLIKFLTKSKYFHHLQENDNSENDLKIVNISEFLQLVKNFEAEQTNSSVFAFLDYLKLLEEAGATLDSTLSETGEDAVQILTVHAAKGLEFPVVFIPSAVMHRFPGRNRKDPIEIPQELIEDDVPSKDMHRREERRLFYVACTRAKKRLFISYSEKYEGNKKWKPSVFVEEIKDNENVTLVDHANDKQTIDFDEKQSEAKQPEAPRQNIRRLSYSQLDTFKTCPLKYQFRYLFGIPSPQAHTANFGTSVHNTLNDFYQHLKNGENVSVDLMDALYKKNWIPYGYENKAHENTRKKKGLEMLNDFYEKNSNPWIVPYALEKPFNLKIGSYTLNGRIDRIDKLKDGTYEIIDYKTGKLKKGTNLNKDLQLSLYALACRDVYKIPVSKLSLYFIEANEKQSTMRTDEQLEEAVEEVIKRADSIQVSNFKATPGFHCSFCEYKLICNKAQY